VLRRATKLFYSGEYGRCLALIEAAAAAGTDPRTKAFWGASRALTRGDVEAGIQVCVEAVRAGRGLPDTYCALGIVLLAIGDRAKARAAFLKGLGVDPRHSQLRARIRSMGVRRRAILPFLERAHPVNRFLGRVRSLLVEPRSA
jgi:Flp pilus assembly protein TadD